VFSPDDFDALYAQLSGDMVDLDCGVRCGKFCCDPNNTTKYLLPGEAELLQARGAGSVLAFIDNMYFWSYGATAGGEGERQGCACTAMRGARPFCCRVFPFRPRIEGGAVVDVQKAKGAHFAPCWIEAPLPQWAQDATVAWGRVLADRDNLAFYAQLALLFDMAADDAQGGAGAALAQIAALDRAPHDELLDRAKRFFDRT
jgi:hypothetical protein